MVNFMINGIHRSAAAGDRPTSPDERRLAGRTLVNCGRDTKLTFQDGSTIVLMGVTQLDAVFPTGGAPSPSQPPPIGGEIGGDGKPATGA